VRYEVDSQLDREHDGEEILKQKERADAAGEGRGCKVRGTALAGKGDVPGMWGARVTGRQANRSEQMSKTIETSRGGGGGSKGKTEKKS
jgi:hypothetical protein